MGNFWTWLPTIQRNTICCVDTRTRTRNDTPKYVEHQEESAEDRASYLAELEMKKKEELWFEDTL
jgi:hypothetical protein